MNGDDRDREYVAFDLETTGLMAETDRIVEVGAVRFDRRGRETDRFELLVNPERSMSPSAQRIHGISDADLADAATARDVLPRFLAFVGDPATTRLLAHNAAFDAGFVGRELGRIGIAPPPFRVIDTLALARRVIPEARDHRLDTLTALFSLDPDHRHRALADSLRVKGLWLALDGDSFADDELVSYPFFDPRGSAPAPLGWDTLIAAMSAGSIVRMEYSGGSRGMTPREVTPRRFAHRGGIAYLVAYCHIDLFEKSFRLDRVRSYEILASPAAGESMVAGKE